MNGTNAGLLVGAISNAIVDCYNITNNASFGYGYNGGGSTSYYAGMIYSLASTSTLYVINYV